MRMQERLVDVPQEVAAVWQEDAARVLEDLMVHLLTKGWGHIPASEKEEREEQLLDGSIDLLFRAGRL